MRTLLALLLASSGLTVTTFAQGDLVPYPTPEPLMRSLDQLEARIPIGNPDQKLLRAVINRPGSYVLVSNIIAYDNDNAIDIQCGDVTLDLNGFTISTDRNAAAAIHIGGSGKNIIIRNGHIRSGIVVTNGAAAGVGFQDGITSTGFLENTIIADVTISGVRDAGINLFGRSIVERCTVNHCGARGIIGQVVSESIATNCGMSGIVATNVRNCTGSGWTLAGIQVDAGSVSNSTGSSNDGNGISAMTLSASTGTSVNGAGIVAVNAEHCFGTTNTGNRSALELTGTAAFCRANNIAYGPSIAAAIAIGCTINRGAPIQAQRFLD